MNAGREETIARILADLGGSHARPVADECCDIPVGVSNRHIHLRQADLETLFGSGYELSAARPLAQPGQYAAGETVCVAGRKGAFTNVRVLGPVRPHSQLEISRSDAFALGINPPVRVSGDLAGAADICVIGPAGMLVLRGAAILARRHIHMPPDDALRFHVANGDSVTVEVGNEKKCRFHDVIVRVAPDSALEFHIDTDEANAADVRSGMTARLA